MRDYYVILGLPRTATGAEIDAAFRSLARKCHPDVRPNEENATAQFKLLSEAHNVLSNDEKRREYDRAQRPGRRIPVSQGPSSASVLRPASPTQPSLAALDVESELRLVPEEALRGGLVEMRVSLPEPCLACRGQAGDACPICEGKGEVMHTRRLLLQLPPKLHDGAVVRLVGHGKTSAVDGSRGDLCLRVRVRPCW